MSKSPLRILITGLFLLSLTACAHSDEDKPSSTPAVQPTAIPATPRSLVLWSLYAAPEIDVLQQIALNFEAAQPMIDVQIQAVDSSTLLDEFKTAISRGEGPDLLIGPDSWLMPLASQGFLQPFGQDFLDQISINLTKPVAHATLLDGTPYAIAFSAEFATLYYNRAVVETPAADYSELVDQGALYKVLITPDFVITSGLYLSSDNRLLDSQGQSLMTQPALETYFTTLHDLANSTGITFTGDPAEFVGRRAGLLLASSADYRTLKAALGDDLGVARLPAFEYGFWRALLQVQPVMLSLNSTAESVQAAREFITFLTKSSTQQEWFEQTGITPVNPAGLTENDLRESWANTLEWGSGAPLSTVFYDTLLPALNQAVKAVTLEGQDPAAAAAQIMQTLPPAP